MAGHSGRHMGWQPYRSRAYCGWARQPPSDVAGPAQRAWDLTPLSVTHTSSAGSWGATAGRGCNGWTERNPHQRSRWHTSALKGRPTSKCSWRPPSAPSYVRILERHACGSTKGPTGTPRVHRKNRLAVRTSPQIAYSTCRSIARQVHIPCKLVMQPADGVRRIHCTTNPVNVRMYTVKPGQDAHRYLKH